MSTVLIAAGAALCAGSVALMLAAMLALVWFGEREARVLEPLTPDHRPAVRWRPSRAVLWQSILWTTRDVILGVGFVIAVVWLCLKAIG
jgi:hypothetical protein